MGGKPADVLGTDLIASPTTPAVPCTPAADTRTILAGLLADVMHVGEVPVHSNFFDDLGGDSLVMAHFCARVRKRDDLPSVSMKDIYSHPTIASLAAALTQAAPALAPDQVTAEVAVPAEQAPRASTAEYLVCGALQLLCFAVCAYLAALVIGGSADWISAGRGLAGIYLRAVLFGGATFAALCVLPVAAKWVLIGRWTPRQIRIWSLGYVRFWIVKTLIRSSLAAVIFAGTPLYVLYLRALGARIGPGAVIWSRHVPVCTDLLTIGAGTVIRKDAIFQCYRAQAGWIQTGPVTVGRDAFIGERAVLDISTAMGDRAQLGHTSALHPGQAVPAGQRWHGSPAQPGAVDYLAVAPARCGRLRKARYCALSLAALFLVYLPLAEGAAYLLLDAGRRLFPGIPSLTALLNSPGGAPPAEEFYADVPSSLIVFCGAVLAAFVCAVTVPRLLNLFITPGKVYPLYGFHDRLHRAILRMTNLTFFNMLFGDSSYVVWYLRRLGYDLGQVEQTGSNFGGMFAHETPFLTSVGTGTMIADGLSVAHADYSSTSFRMSRASIGPRNFVGNNVVYPAGGRTGENCLLATRTMIPLDGPVREGVGLLGSPPFEIPRSVERDSRFDHLRTGEEFRRRLHAKNRYNLRTMVLYLFIRWLELCALALCANAALAFYGTDAHVLTAAFFALAILVTVVLFVLTERAVLGFRRLQPKFCSIYDPYFWRIERLWKLPGEAYLRMFDGTPFKNLIWRALGARIGRRVFDDGCSMPERTLCAIGDDCVLNMGSEIQTHSQEDGTFKSERSTLEAGCTIGVGGLVHYGVTMGERAVLAADTFVMKGEEVPAGARWGGNPAREM
jgi:non-ribosomal peptide synthetase-like protein